MIKAFLFDLDGVFYVDEKMIPGANETLDWLKTKQIEYRFITNNTTLPRRKLTHKLNILGLNVKEEELVSANYAGVLFLNKKGFKSCRLILKETAKEDYKGFNTSKENPEAIVIGDIGDNWNYELLNQLMKEILAGAKMVALHKGRYFQTEKGLTIDSGAFVAALEHSTETSALVVGKPEKPFFELATQGINCKPNQIAMLGDDLINDIGGAQKMGFQTFLVKTGKFMEHIYKKSEIRPNHLIENIGKLRNYILEKGLI